ncbi:MAG: hypothetical protein ACOCV9_05480 [Marinilabiliaceae bacterium]
MQYKTVTAEEAVKVIKSGDRIHMSSVAVTPHALIKPMVERGKGENYRTSKFSTSTQKGPHRTQILNSRGSSNWNLFS